MPLPVGCPFPSPCPNRPYSPYHLTSYFHSPSPERHDPSQGQEKENHCGCVKMRLCPCGLDPQSHTISHATRCVPTLIAGSCWVGHGGAHAFFRYIPLSVETLRATSPFGYVRDACNVSVWVCSRCVQCLSLDRQRVCWRRCVPRLYGVVESWDGSVSANSSR